MPARHWDERFGDALFRHRQNLGYTRERMSAILFTEHGVAPGLRKVHRWESNANRPQLREFRALCRALRLSSVEIMELVMMSGYEDEEDAGDVRRVVAAVGTG